MSRRLLVAACIGALLVWAGPIATAATEGYLDTFETGDYGGNHGTLSFSAPWSEFGDDGSHTSGKVYVSSSGCSDTCLHIDGPVTVLDQFGVSRPVDLSMFQSVTLSFHLVITPGPLDTAELRVEVYDGASWRTVESYSLSEAVDRSVSFDVTAYAAAGSAIRFRVPGPLAGSLLSLTYAGTTEIDDVALTGTLTSTTTTTVAATTTTTLAATTTSPTTSTSSGASTSTTAPSDGGEAVGPAASSTTTTTVTGGGVDGIAELELFGELRVPGIGMIAGYRPGLASGVDVGRVDVLGADVTVDFTLVAEVFRAAKLWLALLALVLALAVVAGIDRKGALIGDPSPPGTL